MLNFSRVGVMALLAGALGVTMTLGVAAPANAISIGGADDLWKYVQTIKGSQLQAASTIGQQAWTRQTAQLAASNANLYTAGTIYGNFDPGDLAEVVPIDKPVDYNTGKRVKVGIGGRGISLPAYQVDKFRKTVGGVGGATVALTAFMFRADIANGVMSWVGQNDVDGLVCAAELGGFVNFITGQDCEAWAANEEYEANSDIEWGVSGGESCDTFAASVRKCFKLIGGETWVANEVQLTAYCFQTTYGGALGNVSGSDMEVTLYGESTWRTPNGGLTLNSAYTQSTERCAGYPNAKLYLSTPPANPQYELGQYRAKNGGVVALPTETDMDPERVFECRVHLASGPVLTGTSAPFTESTRSMVEPNCPATPDGSTPALIEIYELGGGDSVLVWSQSPTPEHTQYEEEFGELCAANSCFLDLVQLSTGLSCFGLEETCKDWMTSPTRDTDYACLYGGVTQPVQECYVYANVFDKQKRLAGNAWADPKTGDNVGGGTSLRFDEALMGAPARSADAIRDCGGAGWGDPNPLEWVLKPIQCALEWAFVPRAAYVEAQGLKLSTALDTRAPGQLTNMIGGWHINPAPMAGCSRSAPWSPANALNGTTGSTVLWDVCPGSPAESLGIMSRAVVGVSFGVMVFLVMKRYVGRTVDY